MSRNPVTVTKDTTVEDAATMMVDQDLSCLPVLEDGKLVGIVSKSDLFKMLLETFGARIPGTTISFLVEDQKGSMAKIIGDISSHGLFLVTCSVLNGTDSSNKLINIKVSGATESELMDIIKPYAIQIMDVRAYS